MCRNIKKLANFKPPATESEIHNASLQFVRKISGFTVPSKNNEKAFDKAIDKIADASKDLIDSIVIQSAPKNREIEAKKAKERSVKRFGKK